MRDSPVACYRMPGIERLEGALEGVGLFATQDIQPDALLALKGGRLMTEQTVIRESSVIRGSHHQVAPNLFLAGLTLEEVDATLIGVNHSCSPTAYADGQIGLRAISAIDAGEEITVDYAMIFSSDTQAFDCMCGSNSCRHRIQPSTDTQNSHLMSKYSGRMADYLANPDAYRNVDLEPLDPTSPITSWRSTKLAPVEARIHGDGVVALERIRSGELLAIRNGRLLSAAEVDAAQHVSRGSEMQLADDVFLGATTEEERLATMTGFNHSCEPNAYLGRQIGVFALRDVTVGEELTVDYATAYISSVQRFECKCGSAGCRNFVDTTSDWMNPELQKCYAGYFTDFIARKIANDPSRVAH